MRFGDFSCARLGWAQAPVLLSSHCMGVQRAMPDGRTAQEYTATNFVALCICGEYCVSLIPSSLTICIFICLMTDRGDGPIGSLPEHLLVEILTRLPTHEWVQISCVSKHWASMFRGEYLWQTAIARKWPSAGFRKRWPGPIPRGSARRRFQALYVSENLVPSGGEIDELVGHTYLYLKEQLERVAVPPSSILHGTIIDQFIACGRTGEKAHELASNIWIAVIDNLEENQQTFMLLKHLAQEGDFFLPFPYSRSYKVLWRVFDKLFTDFRDCFNGADYHEALAGVSVFLKVLKETSVGFSIIHPVGTSLVIGSGYKSIYGQLLEQIRESRKARITAVLPPDVVDPEEEQEEDEVDVEAADLQAEQ
uniref:Uncharacterized protein n=1 Tax=Aegilops tauschii TaxID=37682 RepID=M8BSZ4_AEGTA